MFALRRSPWLLAALLGIASISIVPGPACANIILALGADLQPGVIACLGVNGNCVYVPATTNPAMAFNGGVEAAMAQNGTFIAFALTLQDTSGQSQYASTAITPTFASRLAIAILGTAGALERPCCCASIAGRTSIPVSRRRSRTSSADRNSHRIRTRPSAASTSETRSGTGPPSAHLEMFLSCSR